MLIRGAKAIILDHEDKILIVRRSQTHPYVPLTNDLPGGKVEHGETMLEGVVREIKEEIGVDVSGESIVLVGSHKANDYYGKDFEVELYQISLSARPDVVLSFEHDKYEWMDLQTASITGELFEGIFASYVADRISN